ncbi:putative extracellular tungstate binding protein [Neofusicoccum parvum UCRNP2]|uniref:Putative extracellular tungstate binding protein n=1 Tax=Botryosphaeria parva (strain UCR-NP2) TaxID=1287680 RepID=R1GX88_BOTPV|nr:putative extracellular tungstate binding protein [Neofusicoccum parvum UCRNP2]
MHFSKLQHAAIGLFAAAIVSAAAQDLTPNAIYYGDYNSTNSTTLLRIGNGGAGQSGLVKGKPTLADAFINDSVANGTDPFSVAWITSDTTYSIQYLKTGQVDVGITYSPSAEAIAIAQGTAKSPAHYAFRDHFLIAGPASNPANLPADSNMTATLELMSALHAAAVNATEIGAAAAPVRFLSRYDKSATNIKESSLWLGIGQVPWATAYSTWYHQYIAYPVQALEAAVALAEYTLTDRGTWLSLPAEATEAFRIYKASGDDEDDELLNPAHLLVGEKARYPDVAQAFAEWLVGPRGQAVVTGFEKAGQRLYSGAPQEGPKQVS